MSFAKDKAILRELAKKVAEIAEQPIQKEKAEMWYRHNRLERVKPMVLIFPEGAWTELISEKELQTTDSFFREYEMELRRRIYYWEYLQDDNVIEARIECPLVIKDTGWGIGAVIHRPQEPRGAGCYDPVIKQESDIEKINTTPKVEVDWQTTERHFSILQDVIGDILSIEKTIYMRTEIGLFSRLSFALMDSFAVLRGFEQLYLDLIERPGWVHEAMERMTQNLMSRFEQLEKQNALSLNNRNHYVGSGGVGYTNELPQKDFDGIHVRTVDMWGFAATQVFSSVSPTMHEEFALQYEKRILQHFGLNCYGCCEPLHKKMDIVKKIPNLRRVSVSPWADVEECASALTDKYIFSYKPNPAVIAAERWNPEIVRSLLHDVLNKTKGCIIEIIMKDTHTCRNQPQRLWEWVKIAQKVSKEFSG